ncbi:MATE efflux family protein [Faecalibacterium duncaniae]|uniref:Multidrug export protein MepA n=2 Tax=Faecalibacterium duncaniae (strain DSM 17677 / JCM 31915 / A2-165) TaxID=411483 RepID=C7H387_FAED2|nr:MATE efflux family protein [Faecalibacterium duncaniae]
MVDTKQFLRYTGDEYFFVKIVSKRKRGIFMANADRSAEQFRKMTETPIPKLILSLAAPTILSMLITSIYNLADTFFVGQISTSASGAVGIVSSLMAILQALGFMLGHGSGSIISRSLGSQNTDAATRFASTSFFTALVFGGIITAAGLLTLPDFMMLLGSTETILPHACAYARYILLAAPIMMSSLVMNNILRYEGKASFAMIGLVTGGLLNIALDPLFIFGLGMGTAGAGLATALSQTISFCILLSMFLRGKTVSQFRITAVTHSPAEFGTILMTGMPSFGRQGLNSIGGMLLNIAARGYGDAAVAGMSIVSRIFMFIISVAIGTGQGFQPVAGFNYGAQKYRRVQQACLFTMAASFCFLSVILTVCWFNAETLIRLFRDDPEVTAVALPAFRYQCFAMLLQPVIVAGNMLFQSIGKSGRATFLACCRQGVFFIPLILTLPRAFGLLGVEICQPIADVLTFFVTVPFLFPFLRQLVRMDEAEAAEV